MSKVEIIEKWKQGMKQVDIAKDLRVGESYVSQILAPFKSIPIPTTLVPPEVKRIFDRISRNLDKTWGMDNKMGKEKGRPKYRNLWEDFLFFKEWFEKLN